MATPARAVKSTAGVEGEATAAINQNLHLPPPPTERKVVSLLLLMVLVFKWLDGNMGKKERGSLGKLRQCPFYETLSLFHFAKARFCLLFFCFCFSLFLHLPEKAWAKVKRTRMEDYWRKNIIREQCMYNKKYG